MCWNAPPVEVVGSSRTAGLRRTPVLALKRLNAGVSISRVAERDTIKNL
jgi:hypothetical protein